MSGRQGVTALEALVGCALALGAVGLAIGFLSTAARQGTAQVAVSGHRAAADLVELTLRRDMRRAAGGASGVHTGAGQLAFTVLDPVQKKFVNVLYRVDAGRLCRDGQAFRGATVRGFHARLDAANAPGGAARLEVRVELVRPAGDIEEVLVTHAFDDTEVIP